MDKACWSARDAMDASKCDGCDFQEVTHYCAECPMLLCSRCAVSHRRFKDTKTHTLIEAENKSASSREGKEEIELSSEPVPIFCRIHPDQEIFLFCCKCDDILCRLCRKATHADHETRDLESSKHLLQKLCLNSLTSLFDASTSLKSDDKKIKSSKEYNIQILKRLETELAQRQMALYKHIDQTYDNNLTQLTDETNRIKQVYEKFTIGRNNLLHKSNSLEATLVSIRNIDDVSSLVGALNEFKDVYNQIQRLSIKHVEDAVQLKFDGLQDTKDAENEVLSVTQRFLSIKTKFKDKTLPPVYPSRRTNSGTTSQAKSSSTNTRPPSGNTIHKCIINNGVTLQVIDEDITRHSADMIVNGTMSSVDGIVFIGQLGKAMETAGGRKFNEECRKQRVTPNSFVVTSGGSMPCFKVIHVDIFSIPKTRSSKEFEWKRIIWEILKEAEGLKMFSIAFPPLGIVGLEDAIVTDMVIYYKEVIDRFAAAQPKYLKDIRLVIYNDPALLMIFRDVLLGGDAPQDQTFEVPTVAARLHNLPSISASVGPGGATDLTQWTIGSISQSVGRTGKGIKSTGAFGRQQGSGALSEVMNAASKHPDVDIKYPQNNEAGTPEQAHYQAFPTIKVYRGDITNVQVDAIVYWAYTIYKRVSLDDAVGKALVVAGGKNFRDACNIGGSISESKRMVITSAGDMKYRMVFHINTSQCKTSDDWQNRLLACLNEANMRPLKSIAFPAFGTAHGGICKLAENFKSAIQQFTSSEGFKNIEEIHIVLHDENTCKMFTEMLLGHKGAIDKSVPQVYPSRRRDSSTASRPKPSGPGSSSSSSFI